MLKDKIKQFAIDTGFDLAGITAPEINHPERYLEWIGEGYASSMGYMERNIDKRIHPRKLMDGVRSVICLGVNYYQNAEFAHSGRVARYAWGRDYHVVLKRKLYLLADKIKKVIGRDFRFRAFVDSGPVLEKELAEQAGIGWIGRNSCLVNKKYGSFIFLCELFVDFYIPPDEPAKNYCGRCRRCIDACPTGAIVSPGVVNSGRCISYLTIENADEIIPELAGKIGNRIFGCDSCQEVCPFNRKAPATEVEEFREHILGPSVAPEKVLGWDEDSYQRAISGSSAGRAGLDKWKRNAKIILGDNYDRSS